MHKQWYEASAAGRNWHFHCDGCVEDMFTFSLCCDLKAVSFSCSFFTLASSPSCCLAAITASSFATSSCWARHCCSYKHTCKYTPGRNKKQVIGHQRLSWMNHYLGDNQLGPTAMVPEVSRLPFTLCVRSPQDPSNHWIIKKCREFCTATHVRY